jgi:hypothetical protein
VRVRLLRNRRRAEEDSDDNGDVADQMKTAARHDSLPGFAGAPLIFYNRMRADSRYKVVIISKQQRSCAGLHDRLM